LEEIVANRCDLSSVLEILGQGFQEQLEVAGHTAQGLQQGMQARSFAFAKEFREVLPGGQTQVVGAHLRKTGVEVGPPQVGGHEEVEVDGDLARKFCQLVEEQWGEAGQAEQVQALDTGAFSGGPSGLGEAVSVGRVFRDAGQGETSVEAVPEGSDPRNIEFFPVAIGPGEDEFGTPGDQAIEDRGQLCAEGASPAIQFAGGQETGLGQGTAEGVEVRMGISEQFGEFFREGPGEDLGRPGIESSAGGGLVFEGPVPLSGEGGLGKWEGDLGADPVALGQKVGEPAFHPAIADDHLLGFEGIAEGFFTDDRGEDLREVLRAVRTVDVEARVQGRCRREVGQGGSCSPFLTDHLVDVEDTN
jgi:hypothetical protein